jgi:hypothetical protein
MRRKFCALIVVCAVGFCGLAAVPAAQAFLPSTLPTDTVTPPPDGGTPDTIGNSGGSPPTLDAPEPATLVLGLVGSGFLGLCWRRRRSAA